MGCGEGWPNLLARLQAKKARAKVMETSSRTGQAAQRRTGEAATPPTFAAKMRIPMMVAGVGLLVLLGYYFRRNMLVLVGLALLGVFAYRKFRAAASPPQKASKNKEPGATPLGGGGGGEAGAAPSAKEEEEADDAAAPQSTQLLQKSKKPQSYPVPEETVDQVRHEMFEYHDIKPNLTEEPGAKVIREIE